MKLGTAQRWKRDRLAASGIRIPPSAIFVPVDFETQTLSDQLRHMGFRKDRPAFFSMLGVVIYLTESAVMDTMRFVSSCALGSEITFSFSLPDSHLEDAARERRAKTVAQMAEKGEPWLTFFDPQLLAQSLKATGFTGVDILTPEEGNAIYFPNRVDGLKLGGGGRMASAWT